MRQAVSFYAICLGCMVTNIIIFLIQQPVSLSIANFDAGWWLTGARWLDWTESAFFCDCTEQDGTNFRPMAFFQVVSFSGCYMSRVVTHMISMT